MTTETETEERIRNSFGGVLPKQPIPRSMARLTRQDRAHSDPNLARSSFQGLSSLSVSKQEITLGHGDSLIVYWDIKEDICATDWIGLYHSEEMNPSNFIDFQNRGVTGTRKGQMVWDLDRNTNFRKAVTKVCYRYYHGNSGELRAVSPIITIFNHDGRNDSFDSSSDDLEADDHLYTITVSKVYAENLKKGMFFNPDPYVKLSVKPVRKKSPKLNHHEQHYRTATAQNTVMPSWENQTFKLQALLTDSIEFEVKDKFTKSRPIISRFLGKVTMTVETILQRVAENNHSVHVNLNKHHPSDPITGTLSFHIHLEESENDIIVPNGNLSRASSTRSVSRSVSVPQLMLPVFDSAGNIRPRSPTAQSHNAAHSSSENHEQVNHSHHDRSSDPSSNSDPEEPLTPNTQPSTSDVTHEELSHAAGDSSKSLADVQSIACISSHYQIAGNASNITNETTRPNVDDLPQSVDSGSNAGSKVGSEVLQSNAPGHLVETTTIRNESTKGFETTTQSTDEQSPPSLEETSLIPGALAQNDSQKERVERATEGQPTVHPTSAAEIEMSTDTENPQGQHKPDQNSDYEMSINKNLENLELMNDTVKEAVSNGDAENVKDQRHRTESDIKLQLEIQEEIRKLRMRSWSNPAEGSSSPSPSTATPQETNSTPEASNVNAAVAKSDSGQKDPSQTIENPILAAKASEQNNRLDTTPIQNGAHETENPTSTNTQETVNEVTGPSMDNTDMEQATTSNNMASAKQEMQRRRAQRQHSKDSIWHRRQNQPAKPKLTVNIKTATEARNESDTPTPLPTPQKFTYQRYEATGDEEPLPGNWEARIDQYNRVFYIDHVNRTTTWSKPTLNKESRRQQQSTDSHQSRQQLERRYQSFRRTLQDRTERRSAISVVEETPQPSNTDQTDSSRTEEPPAVPTIASTNANKSVLEAPAVQFITRRDFFNYLHANKQAFNMYQKNSSLKHMVNKIRRDRNKFSDYQHNRDLVALLNLFSDKRAELPRGWEKKKDKSSKNFFINHTQRTTTFIDPRLPVEPSGDDGANLLHLPLTHRERSRSEGEDDVRSTAARMNPGASNHSSGVGPPVQPRPIETLSGSSLSYPLEQKPLAYNEKIVAFLRQPNISDILKERQAELASNPKLRDKLSLIRQEGIDALHRLSNDIELNLLLSLFQDDIETYTPIATLPHSSTLASSIQEPRHTSPKGSPVVPRANARAPAPYRRDFDAKLRSFYKKLESKGYGQGPTKLKITIRREHLLEDAFGKISAITHKDIRKCKLFICFAGEEGLDYGGPSREFFFLLSRQLFNPYYGLFEYSANDTYTVQISPMSAFVDNHMEWFRFCGRVIGLSIIHHYLLDAFFTRPFYKALLKQPCTLSDLESLDSGFHQSLLWMKDNDITEALDDLTFTVDEEVFGQVVERELKANGKNIPVTEKNKKEYIERMVKWRIERGVSEQTDTLVRGFYEVVDSRLISVFDARELELVIAGTAEIDIIDWRKNTEYRGGYQDRHHVIEWFWMAVDRFDNERRLRLLQFVTGTSSIPYEGFAALRGSNGPRKFCIEKWGKATSLPRAHTCFNRLDLPPYTSYAMLLEKLVIAVEETSTFSID
ncbi:E3 ubiquitin-protein ligase HECW2-like [Anneissia japonica]|uniref:E3 ubiquitin-protein ligase HECW2-like n=1 Tax=Anneissia japonica TaxID=1529436 RepID=UPI0014258CF4|nr:E3 ubiquitin-protein ligase HECW2-like [Anneissia japonica]